MLEGHILLGTMAAHERHVPTLGYSVYAFAHVSVSPSFLSRHICVCVNDFAWMILTKARPHDSYMQLTSALKGHAIARRIATSVDHAEGISADKQRQNREAVAHL